MKKIIAAVAAAVVLTAVTGCGEAIGQKAEDTLQSAKEKVLESVKEEINTQVQKILEENGVENAADFDIEEIKVDELEEVTGLDFSTLENMEKIDLGKLDLSQLQELLEQLLTIDFEKVEDSLSQQ